MYQKASVSINASQAILDLFRTPSGAMYVLVPSLAEAIDLDLPLLRVMALGLHDPFKYGPDAIEIGSAIAITIFAASNGGRKAVSLLSYLMASALSMGFSDTPDIKVTDNGIIKILTHPLKEAPCSPH